MMIAAGASTARVSRRSKRVDWVAKSSLQVMAMMLATPVVAQTVVAPTTSNRGGKLVTNENTVPDVRRQQVTEIGQTGPGAQQTVYTGFQTTGGNGSGGGGGLGGAFFIDSGTALTLNNVSFINNSATGGDGGGAPTSNAAPFQVPVKGASIDNTSAKVIAPIFNYGTLGLASEGDPRAVGGLENALTLESFTLDQADPFLTVGATAYLGSTSSIRANPNDTTLDSDPAPGAIISRIETNADGTTYFLSQNYQDGAGQSRTGAYIVPPEWLSIFLRDNGDPSYYGEEFGDPRDSGEIYIAPGSILPGTGLCARSGSNPEVCGTINAPQYGSGGNVVGFSLVSADPSANPEKVSAPLFNLIEVPRFNVASGQTNTIQPTGPRQVYEVGMLVLGDNIPAGTTITAVNATTGAITLSNPVDLSQVRSFRAGFDPLRSDPSGRTIQLNAVQGLAVGQTISGSGIVDGTTITSIDATARTITISQPVGSAGRQAINDGGFQITTNPVVSINNNDDPTNGLYAVIPFNSNLRVGSLLQGIAGLENAQVRAIRGDRVYYVQNDALAAQIKGGSMNGIETFVIDPGSNGRGGRNGSVFNAVFGDGEGTDGRNGGAGAGNEQAGKAGGNGGVGGAGSFGSPINTDLAVAVSLQTVALAADITATAAAFAGGDIGAGIGSAIGIGVTAAGLVDAIVDATAWQILLSQGFVGFGGAGGTGGNGGAGAMFYGGGAGGAGGQGGNSALPATDGGSGGDGGNGGRGGFGAGGGRGGQGGDGGNTGNSVAGGNGDGGRAGFGGGEGSSGFSGGGQGGSGYGGALFVRNLGSLFINGNALFEGNSVAGGSSNDGGEAGQAAGADLFMMKGSTVVLSPGVGNTITFTGGIADDSTASIEGAANAAGQGAGLTIAGGGLVQFLGENTYTGATTMTGATLQADQGVGLNARSRLIFAGTGTIGGPGGLSEANAPVLLTSGQFTRSVGASPTSVSFTGTGGFAATADGLTVSLGQVNGQAPTLVWGSANFMAPIVTPATQNSPAVTTPSTLVFGSSAADATGAVTFRNGINLNGITGRIAVVDNAGSTADRATMTGAITGGALIVNDANYAGSLYLLGQNALTGIVVQNGLVSTLDGSTVGKLMASTGGPVVVSGGTLLLGGAETLGTVMVGQPGTLDARGTITAGNVMNAGTIRLAAASSTGTIMNAGSFTAAGAVTSGEILNSATGVMTFANGVRSSGAIRNEGQFAITGAASSATSFDNTSSGANTPVFLQGGNLTLTGGARNRSIWALAGDVSAANGAFENDGNLTVFGDVATNGLTEVARTRTITAATFTGGTTGQVALGGIGTTANTLVISQTGTSAYAGTVGGAGNLVVTGGGTLRFDGVLSQAGGLRVGQGVVELTAVDTFGGQALIDPQGTLRLTGQGSVAQASSVAANGIFDIAGVANGGTAIRSLGGIGQVQLGANTLLLTAATDSFSGRITGTGGLQVSGGTELLSGNNGYTGATLIAQGAGIGLVGAGSIAASSSVTVNGTLAIGATDAGASIRGLSGASTGSVTLGERTLTLTGPGSFAGVISGNGGVTVAAGGQTLGGVNTFAGRTVINAGAGLALAGAGSVATSSGVTANGLFAISGTDAGASITSLSGTGSVDLGARTLTLTNASETFGGTINGAGGGLTVAGGTEKLSGQNGYTGATTINAGATLGLVGAGSIAASSGVVANGAFAISETTNGATIGGLSGAGTGSVALGARTLTIANGGDFAGVIGGSGGIITTGGVQVLRGVNTFTGRTIVNAGSAVSLVGAGSVAASSGVTANGMFVIAGANGGSAIVSLSGTGSVQLGANTLTLTNASETFAGGIAGSGGLTLAGGTEKLSGQNGYTGATTINAGSTLGLVGTGSIGSSSRVVANGAFAINETTGGAAIRSLAGTGQVQLGAQRLALVAAGDRFDGVVSGTGGLDLVAGTETLGGANTYTGTTTIAANATLALSGAGSIATSAGLLANGTFDASGAAAGVSLVTLAGNGAVTLGGNRLTLTNAASRFDGVIAGTQGITVAAGAEQLGGANSFTGRTIVDAGAGLALVGSGTIAASSGVTANGAFDIAGTNAGASIVSLSGTGTVGLGARTLTLTNASETFGGVINGTGGGLTIAGGTEKLSGQNGYTGATTINAGATLGLVGTGSVASSSGVVANGVFAINETGNGATVATLSGASTGSVALGARTLTVANGGDFAGVIGGSGGFVAAGGTQVLRGVNTYTGRTTVNGGGTLSLVGAGSVATSSGVTANGTFTIAGAAANESVTSLSGTGAVQLGANTLTLTNASETFAGAITGTGGLTVAGGTEKLSGQNGYTGATTINAGATLGLVGAGTVGASSRVVANGVFAIGETTGGAAIRSLAGTGQVQLGAQRLALVAAGDRFDGIVSGTGGLDVMAGSQTLGGVNTYTGATGIAANATLALTGAGSIAGSAGLLANGTFDVTGAAAGVSLVTLAGNGAVTLGGNRLTLTNASTRFDGVIGGTGGVTVAAGAAQLGGVNTFTGRTQVAGGATLALAGNGAIATSGGVDLAGTFDVSGAAGGVSIVSLSGAGSVQLGANALTLTNAADEFDGVIAGTGGFSVAAGTETLGGVNTYTGLTTVASGARLNLTGNGSIAASSGLVDDGVFSIAGVSNGATIQGLFGNGQVILGNQQLTIAGSSAFGGSFSGTGAVAFGGGTTTLSGVNTNTGRTIIAQGTTLALVGAGSIAASSGVTDNGTFSIAGASGPVSITTLSGNGAVVLGANTLTLTNASDTFAGVIGGSGGFTVAAGSEALGGANTYTGRTTIASGAALSLTGAGGIAASSGVTGNGTFSIASANGGRSIASLSGTGAVALGANTLTLTNAGETFAGVIGGSGGLTVAGGTETLTAAQTYTGATTIGSGAALVLTGRGAIAGSARAQADGLLDLSGAAAATLVSLAGNGRVTIGANTLTLTNANDRLAGVISGTGGLTVAQGTETLAGANAFTGRTTVNAGATLALAGSGSIAASQGASIAGTLDLAGTGGDVALNQLDGTGSVVIGGGRLVIGAASGSFTGTVSGAGGLAITGGRMALTGTNSYAGGTQVTNAALTVAADRSLGAAAGPLALQNATLAFGGATTSARATTLTGANTLELGGNAVVLNGTIAGAGGLIANGGGSLTLGGTNSYAGGTTVNGATLRIGSDAALGAAAAALMMQNSTLQATANVTLARDVAFTGANRIDGNGSQVGFTGTLFGQSGNGFTAIATGGLRVSGVLGVDATGFTVNQGAVLRGAGTFNRAMTVAGTLAPGNSPGTMTFNAPVTLTSTGTLQLDIDGTGTGTGAGNYSRLVLTGTNAFTAAGTLSPVLRGITGSATNTFTPSLGQTFTVVQTNVAVNGTFATLAQPSAGLAAGTRFDVMYGNNVTLVVTPADFSNLNPIGGGTGGTGTGGTGTGGTGTSSGSGGDDTDPAFASAANQAAVGTGLNALRGAPGTRLDAATSALFGAIFGLRTTAEIAAFEDRLSGEIYTDTLRAAAARSLGFGQTVDAQADLGTRGGGQLWLASYARGYNLGTAQDRTTYGFAGGAGLRVGGQGVVGIAAGYDSGKLARPATGEKADLKLFHATGYAAWTGESFFARAQAGAVRTDFDVTRSIPLLNYTASGSADGWGFAGSAEVGYAGRMNGWLLQPSIGVRTANIRTDDVAETGAGPVSLSIDNPRFNAVQGLATLRVGREVTLGNGGVVRPLLDIGYLRELDERAARISATFAGAPGTPLTFRSVANGQDALRVGAGVSYAATNGLSLSVRGDLNTQKNVESRSIFAGLGWRW